MSQKEQLVNSFVSFLQAVGGKPEIKTIQQLRQQEIEPLFIQNFRPDRNQIDYIKRKQRSLNGSFGYSKWRDVIGGRGISDQTKAFKKQVDENPVTDEDSDEQDQVPQAEEAKQEVNLSKKQLKFKNDVSKTNTVRCKEIGRIGPLTTELDKLTIFGEATINADIATSAMYKSNATKEPGLLLDIKAKSNWVSIKANTAIFNKAFYYEVQIMTSGVMQIGWASLATVFRSTDGVGDDPTSYGLDGARKLKWNGGSTEWGKYWSAGDVIGTMIDLEFGDIQYWCNDKPLGIAFRNVPKGPNIAYFPAISLQKGERAIFNFGQRPLQCKPTFVPCFINEAQSLINNYYQASGLICEKLKCYATAFYDSKHKHCSDDEKYLVGTVLLDLLAPLLNDPRVFEGQFLPLLYELTISNQVKPLLKSIELVGFDLASFVPRMFTLIIRKLHNSKSYYAIGTNPDGDKLPQLQLILQILQHDVLTEAVLTSKTLFPDLKLLYTKCIMSRQQQFVVFCSVLHDLLPSKPHHELYKKHYDMIYDKIQALQNEVVSNLIKITQRLMVYQTQPFTSFVEWVCEKTRKSCQGRYSDNLELPPITGKAEQDAATLTIIFTCVIMAPAGLPQQLIHNTLSSFPVQNFYQKDAPEFSKSQSKQDRLGGTLQHLEQEMKQQFQVKAKQTPNQIKSFQFLKMTLELFDCGIMDLFQKFQELLNRIYIRHRDFEDVQHLESMAKEIVSEMHQIAEELPALKLVFLTPLVKDAFLRYSTWICALLNYLDQSANIVSLVYAMPTLLVDIPFEIFRAFKRSNQILYDQPSEEQQVIYSGCLEGTTFQKEVAMFLVRHFCDAKIANPDMKELMVIRMNCMLQYQDCIDIIQQAPYAQLHFVQHLLICIDDRRMITHTVKNFLRMSKGTGFLEIIYNGSKGPYEVSESVLSPDITLAGQSLGHLREQLLRFQDQITINFLNSVFNALNDVTSELFVVIKEEVKPQTAHLPQSYERRIRFYFDLVIDLQRILEVVSKWAPEVFLTKGLIHANRLLDYISFVTSTLLQADFKALMTRVCLMVPSRTRTVPQMLAPIIGILTNLQPRFGCDELDSLQTFSQRTDSFNLQLLQQLQQIVAFVPMTQVQQEIVTKFKQFVTDAENAFVDQAEVNDEDLCPICFTRASNCELKPCEHICCRTCIETHLLNNTRCPFCNNGVESVAEHQINLK